MAQSRVAVEPLVGALYLGTDEVSDCWHIVALIRDPAAPIGPSTQVKPVDVDPCQM